MAKHVVILGAQWGDEGKGKVVDYFASECDYVVRFQGGHNAGHTLVIGDQVIKLSLLPSGIMHSNIICLLGGGMVVSPAALEKEMKMVQELGVSLEHRLIISDQAALILPIHIALDEAREQKRGSNQIGTTKRGIGPSYEDVVARRAVKVQALKDPAVFRAQVEALMDYHQFVLTNYYQQKPLDVEAMIDEQLQKAEHFLPYVGDVQQELVQAHQQDMHILYEGAQGSLLDIDHGTYPFVTSSNTTASAVSSGTGLGPGYIDSVMGIVKAYNTRVGAGPFVTELFDETGEHLAKVGAEIGTVTGRGRRCGWLDLIALKRAIIVNGLTHLIITKLDVLDELPEIKVCTAYELDGEEIDYMPYDVRDLERVKPIYQTLPGWQESTKGVKEFKELPLLAQQYCNFISETVHVPIAMLSTGPERSESIVIDHPFKC